MPELDTWNAILLGLTVVAAMVIHELVAAKSTQRKHRQTKE